MLTYVATVALRARLLQLLAAVGERLCEDPNEICGVTCNIRRPRPRLEVWTKSKNEALHVNLRCVRYRAQAWQPRSPR